MLSLVLPLLLVSSSAADTSRLALERQVQAVVIDSLFVRDSTRQVALGDSTVSGGSHFVNEDYTSALRMLGSLPDGLRADFESVRGQRRPVGLLPLRRPVVLVTAAERAQLRAERDPRSYWAAFYRLFPGTPGHIDVSRVGFSRDGNTALVLLEYGCGGRCGGTLYVLVHRVGGRWFISRQAQPRVV
jgi:hypothetical protein